MKRIMPFAAVLCLLFATYVSAGAPVTPVSTALTLTETSDPNCGPVLAITPGTYWHNPGYCSTDQCIDNPEGTEGYYCMANRGEPMADGGDGEAHPWCCEGTAAGSVLMPNAFQVISNSGDLRVGDIIMPPCGGSTPQKLAGFPADKKVYFQVLRPTNGRLVVYNATGNAYALQTATLLAGQVVGQDSVPNHLLWEFIPTRTEVTAPEQ